MKKRIIALVIIVGILTAVVLAVFFYKKEKTAEQHAVKSEHAETVSEKSQKKELQKQDNTEVKKKEEILSMELIGLSDEMLSTLGLEKEEIDTALKKWTQENGYTNAVGAEFYEPVRVRSSEQKLSIDCSLIMGKNGNGIQKEAEQLILTMDYFKKQGLIQFHF